MKKITLKKLQLVNFKSAKDLTIEFNERETNIHGANATGKTTVFDAFVWVLFGKDSSDRKDFNIKTLGADGEPIMKLPHEVTAELEVDGETVTLRKCYTEKWTKPRGSANEVFSGHTVECYYNDVPVSVTEYAAKIAELCDEEVFKLITNPLYFINKKKDYQRAMLINLARTITNADIVAAEPNLAEFVNNLTGKTANEYKKEIAAKKAKIKSELEGIPSRIDERKRSMPEEQNWAEIEKKIEGLNKRIKGFDDIIETASAKYREQTRERDAKAAELAEINNKITLRRATIEKEVNADYYKAKAAHETAVMQMSDIIRRRKEAAATITRLQQELNTLTTKREQLLTEWTTIKNETFVFDESQSICPLCKRPLPEEEIEEKRAELEANFNSAKAARISDNTNKGMETKRHIELKEEEIAEKQQAVDSINYEQGAMEINKDYTADPQPADPKSIIEQDNELTELNRQADEIEKAIKATSVEAPSMSYEKQQKQQCQKDLLQATALLRDREVIAAAKERIAELENQLRANQIIMAELEGQEFQADQYTKVLIAEVEKKINNKFKLVEFKMYEKQINGGEKEVCEAMHEGVPVADQNSAMRINIGLDIINAISEFYDIAAPIFIDNREGVTEIIDTNAQIINLIVDPSCTQLSTEY